MPKNSKIQPIEILLVCRCEVEAAQFVKAFEESDLVNVVQLATDGIEALAYLRREGKFKNATLPGLALIDMDIDIEKKHALEVLAEMKDDPELRSIPVVTLTRSDHEADVLRTYSYGACSSVAKPVDMASLSKLAQQFAQYWALVAQVPQSPKADDSGIDQATGDLESSRFQSDYESSSASEIVPIKILLVEDNDDDVVLLSEAFADSHLVNVVHVVHDGTQALEFLRRQGAYKDAERPGLVLLDINMPKKHGFEVLCEMKEDPDLRNIPVVMLTSSNRESDILKSYSNGACSFVSKPVGFENLRKVTHQFALYWSLIASVPGHNGQQ